MNDLGPYDPAWNATYARKIPEWFEYTRDLFNSLVWWRGRQLTTGCTCQTHDTGTGFAPWVAINCPKHSPALDHLKLHRSRPVPRYGTAPACMCMYGLRRVEGAPGPWEVVRRPGMRRGELMTWAFRIHPRCPHHGDDMRVITQARLLSATVDGRPAWETLDDQERRGE